MSNHPYPNVYWIGGSPCSGKTSVADAIAAGHCLGQYNCDEVYERHRTLITADGFPIFYRLHSATSDELWVQRGVEQQVDEELELYREEFPLILADIEAMPANHTVIIEGAALLPESLLSLNISHDRAIWIVPTEPFQREHYSRREWRHDVIKDTSDPHQAWENWMARDASFARFVADDARSLGFKVVTTDGTRSIAETVRLVEEHFGL
jgi:2-phosphoglycerate kinase